MEIIQISSSPEFKRNLRIWAKEAGMSVSGFVRSACIYYTENVLPKLKSILS